MHCQGAASLLLGSLLLGTVAAQGLPAGVEDSSGIVGTLVPLLQQIFLPSFASQGVGRNLQAAPGGGLAGYQPDVPQTTGIGGPHRLYTSSLAFCSPQTENLQVDAADLLIYPDNGTLYFQLDARALNPNLTVRADINLNVFNGFKIASLTLDFCDNFLLGIFCPLPQIPFVREWKQSVPFLR